MIEVVFVPSVGSGLGVGNLLRCLMIADALGDRARSIFCLEGTLPELDVVSMGNVICVPERELEKSISSCEAIVFDKQGPIRVDTYFQELKQVYGDVPLIVMDYFYRDDCSIDVMINLSNHRETDWPKERKSVEYYEGLDYAVIRSPYLKLRPAEPLGSDRVEDVLVTFGGEDARNWTAKTVSWLEHHVEWKLDVKVIIGALNESIDSLEKIIQGPVFHRYSLMQHARDIEVHARNADLVFCGGGTTILEMAFLGKPVVALPQHNMERLFLRKFEENGFLLPSFEACIGNLDAYPAMRLFRDRRLRMRLSRIGMGLVDGMGAFRIADIIMRKATAFQSHSH
ncbi:MAG: hypothetical protein JSW59_14135 [Phycisphaerales bacterium]|nr:MAG: hypothetical protein JSW59_14135 [Phycisphaerales bacterium]